MIAPHSMAKTPNAAIHRAPLGNDIPQFISFPLTELSAIKEAKIDTRVRESSFKRNFRWATPSLHSQELKAKRYGDAEAEPGMNMNTVITILQCSDSISSTDRSPTVPRRSSETCSTPPCKPKRCESNDHLPPFKDNRKVALCIPDLAPRRPERCESVKHLHPSKRCSRKTDFC